MIRFCKTSFRSCPQRASLTICLFAIAVAKPACAQEPIVLRDLTLIRNAQIESFDESGVLLTSKRRLGWDEVLKANVEASQQERFDNYLDRIGIPMFRLKSRIRNADWDGAGEVAEPLFDAMQKELFSQTDENRFRKTTASFNFLVSIATMKSSLARGNPAKATVAFLFASSTQADADQELVASLGDIALNKRELKHRLSDEILPVWFVPDKSESYVRQIELLEDGRPGSLIYLASLLIENEKYQPAERIIRKLGNAGEAEIRSWSSLLIARIEQKRKNTARAEQILDELIQSPHPCRTVAMYHRGEGVLSKYPEAGGDNQVDLERSKAMLTLLQIPASFADLHPSISAAAIFQSARIAKLRGRVKDEQKLINELLKRHPQSYHGRLASNQSKHGHEH